MWNDAHRPGDLVGFPLVAVLLMPVSSLTVVGVALSSRMFPEVP